MRLRVESGDESVGARHWGGVLLVAAGTDPYDLVDSAVAAAAQLSGGAKPRVTKQQPDFVGSFGWCTWDAFYSQVSAKGVCCLHGPVTEYRVCLCGAKNVPTPGGPAGASYMVRGLVGCQMMRRASKTHGVYLRLLNTVGVSVS